jgi:hypothetical protein
VFIILLTYFNYINVSEIVSVELYSLHIINNLDFLKPNRHYSIVAYKKERL